MRAIDHLKEQEHQLQEEREACIDENKQLNMRNEHITASIEYARRLQNAIIPEKVPFDNTFVLFRPKDIVSGDFYWFIHHKGVEYMAAVDCTGHGVPGAFMSFMGHILLKKIVVEQGIEKPSDILWHLNKEVIDVLQQQQNHSGSNFKCMDGQLYPD